MNVKVLIILFLIIIVLFISTSKQTSNNLLFLEYFDPPSNEVENLKMLSKYLLLIIRQRDAQDDLYKLSNGHARVYHSPKLDLINKQIADFKERIRKDPETLRYFTDNIDLMI